MWAWVCGIMWAARWWIIDLSAFDFAKAKPILFFHEVPQGFYTRFHEVSPRYFTVFCSGKSYKSNFLLQQKNPVNPKILQILSKKVERSETNPKQSYKSNFLLQQKNPVNPKIL
jgi:hypothetical protein